MSFLLLRRLPARSQEAPGGTQLTPDPLRPAQPRWPAAVIFTVVASLMMWLLARGYTPPTALGIVAGTGIAAASITSWLAGTQPSDS